MLKKSWLALLIFAIVFATFGMPQGAAQALGPAPSWQLTQGAAATCTVGANFGLPGVEINIPSGQASEKGVLSATGFPNLGTTIDTAFGPFVGPAGFTVFATAPFSLPPNTKLTLTVTTYAAANFAGGTAYVSTITWDCTTGAVVAADFVGPGIPSGFVQRGIACTTPVFDGPNGTAVAGAVIRQGQSWYVNPTPTAPDVNGRRWTEIFVSGARNGYIPAECVGGQEPLAPTNAASSGGSGPVGSVPGVPAAPGTGTGTALTGGANGQTITNPAGQTVYIVALGDRLYRIALKFGVSVTALAAANGVVNFNLIYPGQQLIIPR